MCDEQIVQEGGDIVEDRFCVEEELGEKGEVLGVEFMFFTVDFIEGVVGCCVDGCAWWGVVA